ncbi:hypothetical protein K469DRAFT_385220 [Zopfia rhizophila CBS 207.26]|uniref:Uncharacterized protein n=1 Tax=Zopfia rhizophila CBS 207.26 TaxID=1314779 RepID=A0A6A6EID4_9PEZI|nr:hypothetical protein K469DRAFT_385220 [Zopfia rhizophila CBS 207.26]
MLTAIISTVLAVFAYTILAGHKLRLSAFGTIFLMISAGITAALTAMTINPWVNDEYDWKPLRYNLRLLLWFVLSILNFCCSIWWRFTILTGVLLMLAFVTHLIAYSKCQPLVISRVLGGAGVEQMVLFVPSRRRAFG